MAWAVFNFSTKHRLVYNKNTMLLFCALFLILLGALLGFIQEAYCGDWDVLYAIDIWSFAHLSFCAGLYCLFLFFTNKEKLSLTLCIILTTLFEPFEQLIMFRLWGMTLAEEFLPNTLMDIPFNLIGICLVYSFFHYYNQKQCEC
jgi:hypothetical protein